ncbi:MAG: hypothetical protein PWQ82_1343 [Thermosediminibacterales bacterium]|nr:hypothetical protein [Thermosediminibacterales bacterium]MDK2835609.1 hypothetical protein [Thermosediminibacterales bacterium]
MNVIEVKDVWKKYRIYHDKGSTLKEKLLFRNRNKYEERWVLKGINLNIQKGQTVGLIGENGSGKSTLLKLISRIIYPNRGEIKVRGKVSSLLELGAGFHPDMTGRENIYTNASIFGLTRKEIDNKLDDIIAFSELEDYIDNPVRIYSSGMYMRLAFSVAINVDADILLIDEILAVGDVSFQKKCFNKIKELKNRGTTIVIVSHNTGSLEKICNKIVWLNKGVIQLKGEPPKIIDNYLQYMKTKEENRIEERHKQTENKKQTEKENNSIGTSTKRWGSQEVEIYNVKMLDLNGNEKHCFSCGDRVTIQIYYKKHKDVENYVFGVGIFNHEGISCYGTNTHIDGMKINNVKHRGVVEFKIKSLLLLPGKYLLDVAVHAEDGRAYDYQRQRYEFEVVSVLKDVGICRLEHEWQIN